MQRSGIELFSNDEMSRADRLAVAGDVTSRSLMEAAGGAVAVAAEALLERLHPEAGKGRAILILCGRGSNGGDGFVAANRLAAMGQRVRVALLGQISQLRGDAALAAADWRGVIEMATSACLDAPADLIIDALLGAGLRGAPHDACAELIEAINGSGRPVLAVDVPSGLDGSTGGVPTVAVQANETVTFFRRKPGHLLLPGRQLCGRVTVADIGMPASVISDIGIRTFHNEPALWRDTFPYARTDQHKYDRGHAVVVGGPPDSGGAARLSARAALRVGAGLVTLASPSQALPINACHLNAIMVRAYDDGFSLAQLLSDRRKNVVVVGPGLGIGDSTLEYTVTCLRSGAAVVIDADSITSAADSPAHLFANIGHSSLRSVVLTPHEGEFARLFPDLAGSKLDRARAAAARSGAVVLIKGPDTVIAEPGGRAAINDNAPPALATAGSGDVLSGLIAGLLAQGMPGFEAAAAGVWLHGQAATLFGPGLIAEDLPEQMPKVLAQLCSDPSVR